jgi:hypothetical protein
MEFRPDCAYRSPISADFRFSDPPEKGSLQVNTTDVETGKGATFYFSLENE